MWLSTAAVLAVALVAMASPAAMASRRYSISSGTWNVRSCLATCGTVDTISGSIPNLVCQTSGPAVTVSGFGTSTVYDMIRTLPQAYSATSPIWESSRHHMRNSVHIYLAALPAQARPPRPRQVPDTAGSRRARSVSGPAANGHAGPLAFATYSCQVLLADQEP